MPEVHLSYTHHGYFVIDKVKQYRLLYKEPANDTERAAITAVNKHFQEIEAEEKPKAEKYENYIERTSDLIAAAIQRTRAEGIDAPYLEELERAARTTPIEEKIALALDLSTPILFTAKETTSEDTEPPTLKAVTAIDNKRQFDIATLETPYDTADTETRHIIAAKIAEILAELMNGNTLKIGKTSEIVKRAIDEARAEGIDAPYLEELERVEEYPAQPELFPDYQPQPEILTATQEQEISEKIQRYQAPPYITPETVKIPTANLARNIHNADMEKHPDGEFFYPVDKRPHEHFVFMTLLDKIGEQYPIAPIDKNILISLGNLYAERKASGRVTEHGGAIITAEDIIRLYRGYDADARITAEDVTSIQDRIDKMVTMRVSFDFTQHFQYNNVGDEVQLSIPDEKRIAIPETEARRLPANTTRRAKDTTVVRFSYAGNMIDARTIEVEYASGRIEKAYEILTPPIVYEYAEKVKQIQQVETKLLDLRKRANSGNDTDTIKIYLLEQINAMKRDKTTRTNRILLDTLFADLRIEVNNRPVKKRKMDIVKKILEHFKTTKQKNGKPLISGYTEVIGYRRAVIGYDIHITTEKGED